MWPSVCLSVCLPAWLCLDRYASMHRTTHTHTHTHTHMRARVCNQTLLCFSGSVVIGSVVMEQWYPITHPWGPIVALSGTWVSVTFSGVSYMTDCVVSNGVLGSNRCWCQRGFCWGWCSDGNKAISLNAKIKAKDTNLQTKAKATKPWPRVLCPIFLYNRNGVKDSTLVIRFHTRTHTHTHTKLYCSFSGFCLGLPRWAGTRKVKPGR